MLKRIPISSNDFSLFDAELNSYEYEYFCKHIGAFKRFMQEEPREQRQLFLDAFCEYSYNHIEIKAIASMSDPKKKFIESFRQYTQETFINGKFSAAKQFLNDSVIVARNKHMIQYMDSHSYAKDPFFHKETRDVFRRLFGEPTEAGTCVKILSGSTEVYFSEVLKETDVTKDTDNRFAGSICRYLKKWLDVEESLYPMPVKGKKSKAEKKAMKEQALAIAKASSQHTRPMVSNPKTASSTSQQNMGAVGNTKTGTGLHMISTVGSSKIIDDDGQSRALVLKSDSKAAKAEPDSSEDFSNFYYDMHERKQRKRDFRKKGKKFEPIACQHPCHGKVCNCNPHKHNHAHAHGHAHDHAHDHHDQPQATREELMSCLCEKHKALAEAKIAEKRAALDKHLQNEGKKSGDNSSEGDKSPGGKSSAGDKSPSDKNPEDKSSVVKPPENKDPEGKSSQVENSEGKISDDKNSEGKNSGEVNSDGISSESAFSENKSPENANSGDQENKRSVVMSSEGEKPEDKSSEDKNLEEHKSLDEGINLEVSLNLEEVKNSEEGKNLEEGKAVENKELEGSEKSESSAAKEPEVKSPRGKKPHKRIRENGLVSSDDSSDCDAAVERFVRKTFPELLLGEDHPNQQYEKIVADEKARRQKLKENKLRTCSFCRKQETEVKSFKKCQKCKGKGTKFYCSRDCQKMDWTKHRLEH